MSHHDRDEAIVDDDDGDDDYYYDDDDEDYDDDSDRNLSLDDIVHEKLERIATLERSNEMQQKDIEAMQKQLNESDAKHKGDVYWLKLELDNTRRDKDAVEERMAELYKDLRDMFHEINHSRNDEPQQQGYPQQQESSSGLVLVSELQAKMEQYERTLGIMDNQVSMVKTSCDEVVKTLKEEISDLMEDRCRMEIDLLNQLALLDREKKETQMKYVQRLKLKDATIQRLRDNTSHGVNSSNNHMEETGIATSNHEYEDHENDNHESSINHHFYYTQDDMDELECEIAELRRTTTDLKYTFEQERSTSEDTIARLQDFNAKLQRKLESTADDLAVLRMAPNSEQIVHALDRMISDREDVIRTLEHLASLADRSDASVTSLEGVMYQLRSTEKDKIQGEGVREQLLTTLEAASLVHGQVKLSLLLLEARLQNQLSALKRTETTLTWVAPSGTEVAAPMRDVQQEALMALKQVESTLLQRIQHWQDQTVEERVTMQRALQERTETLQSIQAKHKILDDEIERLHRLKGQEKEKSSESADSPPENDKPLLLGINPTALDDLHKEVLGVVERIQVQNTTIKAMQQELGEYASREKVLKKELKRALRRCQKLQPERDKERESSMMSSFGRRTTKVVLTKLSRKRPSSSNHESPTTLLARRESDGRTTNHGTPTPDGALAPVEPSNSPLVGFTTSSGETREQWNTSSQRNLKPSRTRNASTTTCQKSAATKPDKVITPLQPSPRELNSRKSAPHVQNVRLI
jgi:hypothetical protein